MNLRINEKAFKKIKNKTLKMFATVASATYIMTGINVGFETLNDTIKCDYYDFIYNIDEDLIQPLYNNDFNSIDYDKFSKITILSVDMATTYDLGFLKYCSNLKKIEIINAQLLNDLHIDELNETTIKEYILMFDKNSVIKDIYNGFDLNRFAHKDYIKQLSFIDSSNEEMDSIILYEYLKNIEGICCDIKYKEINSKLDNIIDSLNLSGYQGNVVDLIEIINYIVMHFNYDEQVNNYMDEYSKFKKFDKTYNKIVAYNKNPLLPILDVNDNSEVDIICANYSSIFTTLCLKGGIKNYEIEGDYDGIGHKWNLIKFENNYYYIDLTYIDSSLEIKNALNIFRQERTIESYYNLINQIFIPVNSEYAKYYSPTIDIDVMLDKEIKTCDKECFFGTSINKNTELRWYFLLSMFGYIMFNFLIKKSYLEEKTEKSIKKIYYAEKKYS